MSQLDDLLGGLLDGQGGSGGGLEDMLGQLTGGQGGGGQQSGANAGGAGILAMLVPLVAGFLKNGGLNKILSGLQQQGLGSQAQSWIGTGENEAVPGANLEQAIGQDEIAAIARQLGISRARPRTPWPRCSRASSTRSARRVSFLRRASSTTCSPASRQLGARRPRE